jgi:hypothetical protein
VRFDAHIVNYADDFVILSRGKAGELQLSGLHVRAASLQEGWPLVFGPPAGRPLPVAATLRLRPRIRRRWRPNPRYKSTTGTSPPMGVGRRRYSGT